MFRNLCIVGVILSLTLVGIRWSLQDQRILRWADSRLGATSAAAVDYGAGELCYICQDYTDAEIYLQHVVTHYPKSPDAESARWMWLECLCVTHHLPSTGIITECQNFLEQYPDGEHASQVRQILKRRQELMSNQMDINPAR
jgi:outer membrane protein assembly factor BamD (BamD/ComL family)